jgi:hypothetical protein
MPTQHARKTHSSLSRHKRGKIHSRLMPSAHRKTIDAYDASRSFSSHHPWPCRSRLPLSSPGRMRRPLLSRRLPSRHRRTTPSPWNRRSSSQCHRWLPPLSSFPFFPSFSLLYHLPSSFPCSFPLNETPTQFSARTVARSNSIVFSPQERYDDARAIKSEISRLLEPAQRAMRHHERATEEAMVKQMANSLPKASIIKELNRCACLVYMRVRLPRRSLSV